MNSGRSCYRTSIVSSAGIAIIPLEEASVQAAVETLVELGPLPAARVAEASALEAFESLLEQVRTPVSEEEAAALCVLFGPDECFGLAWSLVHLIETAPQWPVHTALATVLSPWRGTLRERL